MTAPSNTHDSLVQNLLGADLPTLDHARGVWLFDDAGGNYIDGCSGAVVANVGHSHPRILDAMNDQAQKATFVHRGAFVTGAQQRLARRLTEATGFAGAWFVNSGSEAIEASIHFALQYHREKGQPRTHFLSHNRSYHGNTLGALSLSGHARREVISGLAYDFNLLPNPYTKTGAVEELLEMVEAEIATRSGQVAGIVVEPLSGATMGCNPLPDGYLEGLRRLCDQYDILLIADEVMTGLGRTGKMLACEHWGVSADLVALGKGLGAGYTPIAATLVAEKVLDSIVAGTGRIRGGHTYAGNPLSVAVADEVLSLTIEEGLVEASRAAGEALATGLRQMASRHAMVTDVRGHGLMQGIELKAPGDSELVGALAERLRLAAFRHGLLIYPTTGGFNDACIVAPPLTITDEEMAELLLRLEAAVAEIELA